MSGLVLSLFDLTGKMVKPWKEAGYETLCVDMQRDGTDIRYWLPPRTDYQIVFAFPPCQHQAVSGARWFKLVPGEGMLTAVHDCLQRWLQDDKREVDHADQSLTPYPWEDELTEDRWIYENIITLTYDQLSVAYKKQFKLEPLSRNGFKSRSTRFSEHHRKERRNFAGVSGCQ